MPPKQALPLSPTVTQIAKLLPADQTVYLVGGALRDALLGRLNHDLDFVLVGDVYAVARRLADQLGGAFYPLDPRRNYARIILRQPGEPRQVLYFAPLAGHDLESDLRQRDFTINAIAVAVHDLDRRFDPLGGAADLHAKRLRACSPTAFQQDPLRILRAVRLAFAFTLNIVPDTRTRMRQAVPELRETSPERLRDELFRILEGTLPGAALRALEMFGALEIILPELCALKGVEQPPPHVSDAWEHTLTVINRLEDLLQALAPAYDPDKAANLAAGLVVMRLGRYRQQFAEHFSQALNVERSPRGLLFLAALYHDSGKPEMRQVDENGRIRFFDHEQSSLRLVEQRLLDLHMSNLETERVKTIVRHHMRPLLLAQLASPPTRRATYRFFRDCGAAGVDICLLALADMLATYGPNLPTEAWEKQVDVVRALLEAWWERPAEQVSPPAILDGHDLMEVFQQAPGAHIGEQLAAVREAQATGLVRTREEALDFVRKMNEQSGGT